MFQILYLLAHTLIQVLRPILGPLCLICTWTFLVIGIWNILATVRASLVNAKRMHQIPCSNCQFFTGDYHLKCAVHPSKALSEAAINCPDYQPMATYGYPQNTP
ncbi:MAG: hypothetical protein F6K19_43980 [Cyanothece sp. SIO1E1]|nr:hypothetical protein [Cyanothece sp. SIO1E1]